MERVAGATEALTVGQADDFATQVPPLIEREAQERVLRYQRLAGEQGRLMVHRDDSTTEGWFAPPTVAIDLPAGSPVLGEEIFGPLLTVEAMAGIEAACEVVEALPFGLTGGLFSRSPATVDHVAARLPIGNLYVNRGITGAKVGRQPFGGNRRSGVGSKAGGPGYLLQFTEPHVVCENTVRHGLVVE